MFEKDCGAGRPHLLGRMVGLTQNNLPLSGVPVLNFFSQDNCSIM